MNYYELLEVSQNASKEVIRAAYKSLMQRYHPDKNPGNAEIASRAALLVQAYEILSDADKRSNYDQQIKNQPESRPSESSERKSSAGSSRKTYLSEKIAENNQASWYPWLLISVIILSGGLILSLSRKQPLSSQEIHVSAVSQISEKSNPASLEQPVKSTDGSLPTGERKVPERAIRLFSTTLKVRLKVPEKLEETPEKTSEKVPRSFLLIPILLVKVGSFDSEKFIQYIESRKDSIGLELTEKLADAKAEELLKADGERYLKRLILDALGDITGTNRFEDFPPSASESPGRHGVTDVVLPESFSLE